MNAQSTSTTGVRTWRRTGADASAPLAERVTETTLTEPVTDALASADFVTIPRSGVSPSGAALLGYDDAYAEAFGHALAERFGYAGGRRVSASGRSHVFEREPVSNGVSVDFGLPAHGGILGTSPSIVRAAVSGDGVSRGEPSLATR